MKYFNNFSLPQFEAHQNYIGLVDTVSCRYVNDVHHSEVCEFSKETQSCHELEGRVDYAHMMFCQLAKEGITTTIQGAEILSIAMSLLFVLFIAILSYVFFLPNLLALTKFFKLNEHTAGFCILAMANAMPEILGVFVRFEGDTEMLVNELMGTTMYLKAFHVGFLSVWYPLAVFPQFFLRDSIFFLVGLLVFDYLILVAETALYEAIGCILICIVYVVFIFVQERMILKSYIANKSGRDDVEKQSAQHLDQIWHFIKPTNVASHSVKAFDSDFWGYTKQFVYSINPIRREMFNTSNFILKCLLIIGSPFTVAFYIFIPVVNHRLPMDGWSKPLNCLNLILMPLVLEFALNINFKYCIYFMIPGMLLAIIVLFTSKCDVAPNYHMFFAFYGFLGCTLLSYVMATEMVAVWYLIGSIEGLSRSTIGITFLTWGNTIQEIVINYALATWGYPLMSFVAFYSVPMLNMVFALALTIVIQAINLKVSVLHVRQGATGGTGMVFNIVHHLVSLMALCCTNFKIRRSFGVYSMIIYFIYLLFVVLIEQEYIHAYGTDHSADSRILEADWA